MNDFFCLRFPHIVESIFDQLNNESLVNCKEVGRCWNNILDDQVSFIEPKFLLMRKMVKLLKSKNQNRLIPKITKIATKINSKTFQELEMAVYEFYEAQPDEAYSNSLLPAGFSISYDEGTTLIHIAAGSGNTELLKYFFEKNEDWLCKDSSGHVALGQSHDLQHLGLKNT